ncbi:hypothetical protein N9B82_01060 [Saprospiraceae bacterium]|nr:hypothetical protein [Saprospiraceae bacterium]
MVIRIVVLICMTLAMISCAEKTLESEGGTRLKVEFKGDAGEMAVQDAATILQGRLANLTETNYPIYVEAEGNMLSFDILGLAKTAGVKELVEWDRSMKLSYAINPSSYEPIRAFLADYVENVTDDKPYKASSMIGMVAAKDLEAVEGILNSEEFKNTFPEIGKYYWGEEKMDEKSALFCEAADTPFINESMFKKIGAFASKDGKDGILSLELLPEFTDRIGKLTGNDSTYLLHSFHNEVYISKIIKPHITSANFSMLGAFSPNDALVLSTLWNSEPLDGVFTVKSMAIVKPTL